MWNFSSKPAVRRNSVLDKSHSVRCLLSLNVRNGCWWTLKTKTHTGGCFPVSVCLSLAHQVLTPLGTLPVAVSQRNQLNYFLYMTTHLQVYASGSNLDSWCSSPSSVCVCVCVCLNIYRSERIRFSCKMFAISLPLGTGLIWHDLVLRFSVTGNAIYRLGWWHFKTHIVLRWFNYLYN